MPAANSFVSAEASVMIMQMGTAAQDGEFHLIGAAECTLYRTILRIMVVSEMQYNITYRSRSHALPFREGAFVEASGSLNVTYDGNGAPTLLFNADLLRP
jgi:hypothetical protein